MTATTTDIALDLQSALMAAGLTYKSATHVVTLLPPAGRHELLTGLRAEPDALRMIANTYIGEVADRLRITHSDADVVRAYCRMVAA